MAYSGFISDPEYTRRSQNEKISGQWTFDHKITFNETIQGTAIATYYGDLAEYYSLETSENLPQGTLVKLQGKAEITKTKKNDRNFFGIISSQPGIMLNSPEDKANKLPVALFGKVPCRVNGKIKKFDKLTTSKIPGVACKKTFLDFLLGKPTIGISLENKEDKSEKIIEIVTKAHI